MLKAEAGTPPRIRHRVLSSRSRFPSAKSGLIGSGLIPQQQAQLPFRRIAIPCIQVGLRQVDVGFMEAGELLKGFSIETNRFHVVAHSPAGIPAVEEHVGREKASGLSLFIGPQRQLMLSQLGMGQACQVRNLTGMGMTVEAGHLIQHLLGAVLADGLIQMGEPSLRAVVGRPLALRWIYGRKRWPLQGPLGRAELLLSLEQLLLQPGDLEVTITQLLQRIHQGIRVQGGKGADLVAPSARQPIAIGPPDRLHTGAPIEPDRLCCRRLASVLASR